MIGVGLLLVTLFMCYTGYLLPWETSPRLGDHGRDLDSGYAPGIGDKLRFFLLGGDSVGGEALLRFYVLHVAVLPLVLSLLIGLHFWRIRKDGGLARPSDSH